MIKWLFRLLILLIALATALALLIDSIAKELIESYLSNKLGTEVAIEKVDVNLTAPRLRINNFVIYNPARFGGTRFVEIPEISIEYDFYQALRLNAYLKLVRIDCSSINLISDQSNRLNIEEFIPKEHNPTQKRNNHSFFIETLNISIGIVRWINIESPAKPQEVKVNARNYILKNISSKDFNTNFFNNLLTQILLQSGKVGIKDGRLIILDQNFRLKK